MPNSGRPQMQIVVTARSMPRTGSFARLDSGAPQYRPLRDRLGWVSWSGSITNVYLTARASSGRPSVGGPRTPSHMFDGTNHN